MQAVLLPVGDELYAFPVGWVREVTAAPKVTSLVTAPPVVLGLFNLRGEIVPLLDTAALLGVGTIGTAEFVTVVRSSQGPIGMAATTWPYRATLDTPIGKSDLPGTAGAFRVGNRVAVLVDPAVLLTPERMGGPGLDPGRVTVEAG